MINKLIKSYTNDEQPFRIDSKTSFVRRRTLFEELELFKEIFFPQYWNRGVIITHKDLLETKIASLKERIIQGIRPHVNDLEIESLTNKFLETIPHTRELLKKDVEAAYNGDPAAKDYAEIIRSYPGFQAIMIQRVAHVLYNLNIPSYPRELMEEIHSLTGIDIHPGADIGEYFFIDHGTGVVIGESTKIGDHVRIYQGVTLGALHFEKDDDGLLKKDYKRHPHIGDHVIIGMGAKILGPIKIGNQVNIGANSWVQESIPDKTTVYISEHPKLVRKQNGGV